jgi:hypothetical protein
MWNFFFSLIISPNLIEGFLKQTDVVELPSKVAKRITFEE